MLLDRLRLPFIGFLVRIQLGVDINRFICVILLAPRYYNIGQQRKVVDFMCILSSAPTTVNFR